MSVCVCVRVCQGPRGSRPCRCVLDCGCLSLAAASSEQPAALPTGCGAAILIIHAALRCAVPCCAAGIGWTSGAIYTEEERLAAVSRVQAVANQEQAYLDALRNNETLPVRLHELAPCRRTAGAPPVHR